ncbi:MAG: hypothetical protein JW394_0921 [Nitrospira sp.]|nr:hypothetical protein [Nitrospira sp.]
MLGVLAPHDALQFRELTDHTGEQVGLAEIRRPLTSLLQLAIFRLQVRRNEAGQLSDPLLLLLHRAKLLMERDPGQLCHPLCKLDLPVFVKKELGIGQTSSQDPLVAFANQSHIFSTIVSHRNEVRD